MSRRRRISDAASEAKEAISRSSRKRETEKILFPSGCTVLNLALSDTSSGGYIPGSVVNIVGDSSAGKTFLGWTLFAEVANDPRFDEYELIYDEPESAFYMDYRKLFGIKPDRITMGVEHNSDTIQNWYRKIMTAIRSGKPFIYLLDSFDSLSSTEEKERIDDLVKKGVEAGSWKMEKPKVAGELLRNIVQELETTNSLVIVISQTRDNIGVTFGEKRKRSGGRALRFYSTHELWLSVRSHEKRKDREVGVNVIAKTKKNKYTGKLRTVEFPIWYDYGVDDINASIDFLIEEKYWSTSGNKIITNGVFEDTRRDLLIRQIEEEGKEDVLRGCVHRAWIEIEESIKSNRKPKYAQESEEE